MTRLRSRISLPVWGLLGLLAAAAFTYVIFGGRGGVGDTPFELQAVFRSEAQLGIRSPVRIAGVDVGKVTQIKPMGHGSDAALVTMKIEKNGLPIHTDATAKIRSRLLLEGNFFVELSPGTPAAPDMRSGATIPVDATSGPVQLDRILSDLPQDPRMSLRTLLQGYGGAIGAPPTRVAPGEDPSTQGETAGESLNDALVDLPDALLGTAVTTNALLGLRRDDLVELIRGESRVLGAFASRETQLASLIGGFNTTMAAFASRQGALRETIALLPQVLRAAGPALDAVDDALPPTRAFARKLTPSLAELPPTIEAAGPWIEQTRALLSPDELGGLDTAAQPATESAARLVRSARPLLRSVDAFDRCLLENLLPVGDLVVQDPPLTTGVPAYREFLQTFVGVTSAFQNFDGNGVYGREMIGGGTFPQETNDFFGEGPFRGNATRPPLGTRPAFGGKAAPPYRRDVPCAVSDLPDVNGAKTGPGP